MKKLLFISSAGNSIAENLAAEEYLCGKHENGCGTLFLWSNPSAVVIGRNQNPWKECNFAAMRAYRTDLARRKTGGGAVYQDDGNLNFSFIMDEGMYEPGDLCGIVTDALSDLGVRTCFGGRNDLLLPDGRKFSGLAASDRNGVSLIHGTMMINVNLTRLEQCLCVPKEKLAMRGIDSVRMRVANLRELSPRISERNIRMSLRKAWEKAFSLTAEERKAPDEEETRNLTEFYRSRDWTYGRKMSFDAEWRKKFGWGMVCLCFQIDRGRIKSVRAETDSLDTGWPELVEQALCGSFFLDAPMEERIDALTGKDPGRSKLYDDLCGLIRENL